MSVTWAIESEVFESTAKSLAAAVEREGDPWFRYADDTPRNQLPEKGACVVFYGSLNAAQDRIRGFGWVPGVICNTENLTCSTYYPHLSQLLLSKSFIFSTVEALVSDPGDVIRPLDVSDRIFVRPDSPLKPFSGRVLEISELSLEALDHGYYYDDVSLPVVVSPVRQVDREWRLVIADAAVIAGCEYQAEGREACSPGTPDEVAELAGRVARLPWQPDPIYVVDVCSSAGSLHVLELNSFSCSDLYACAPDAVVQMVSRMVEKGTIAPTGDAAN